MGVIFDFAYIFEIREQNFAWPYIVVCLCHRRTGHLGGGGTTFFARISYPCPKVGFWGTKTWFKLTSILAPNVYMIAVWGGGGLWLLSNELDTKGRVCIMGGGIPLRRWGLFGNLSANSDFCAL